MMDSRLLSLKWDNHGSTFFHVLSSIRRKGSYTDVTITCDGKFYPVHKLVLSTCSEYFEEVFERTQCKHPVIVLKDIKHEELEALLNYMYLGEVDVLQAELSGLIKAAECLKIKGLAISDEAPSSKSESTKENKRSSSSSSSGSPLHKRLRQDDPTASSTQSCSEDGFTSPSFRSPNQASEVTRERRAAVDADSFNDSYRKKGDSISNSSQPVEVLGEDTSTVKGEIEEPKEDEENVLNSDRSLPYSSMAPGMASYGDSQNVFKQHMSAGSQNIENLVAQSLPGPSSVQGNWAGRGGGDGGSAENFPLEGIPLVLVEDTPTVKKEPNIEEPKEEEEDFLNSDNSLAYDSMTSGMASYGDGQNFFKQHMSAPPQGVENLVAQPLPGPSSLQGKEQQPGFREICIPTQNIFAPPNKPVLKMSCEETRKFVSSLMKFSLGYHTGMGDPIRKPVWWPREVNWMTKRLKKTKPQDERLVKTDFQAIIISYYEHYGISLPPATTDDYPQITLDSVEHIPGAGAVDHLDRSPRGHMVIDSIEQIPGAGAVDPLDCLPRRHIMVNSLEQIQTAAVHDEM